LFCTRFHSKGQALSKTAMNDVPKVPNGDFENTLPFPSDETPLDSAPPSHFLLEMSHARMEPSMGFS
jgi:hypothetical protein